MSLKTNMVRVLLGLSLCAACLGCADSSAQTSAQTSPHRAAAQSIPRPKTGVDLHPVESAGWSSPDVTRQPDGHFIAQLSPHPGQEPASPVSVRLNGIGHPRIAVGRGTKYVGPGVLTDWTGQSGQYTVSVDTTASRVSLLVWNLGGTWQPLVDQKPVGSPRSVGSSYTHQSLDVVFPPHAAGVRRTVTFALSGSVWFTGLRLGGPDARAWLPREPDPSAPITYWIGDSYSGGAGATHPGFDDLVHLASTMAGLSDVTTDALGGTGYVRTNTIAHFPRFQTRVAANLGAGRAQPQLVVVAGSINDAPYGEARVRRAARALYRQLAAKLPKAAVVVIPFTSEFPIPSQIAAANDGIMAAARAAPNVVGLFDLPAKVLSLTGVTAHERRSGALVSSVVKFHPSEVGHELYGRLIGQFLAQCVHTLHQKGAAQGVCNQPG
jgi:lysophospholipase L1-like esterase